MSDDILFPTPKESSTLHNLIARADYTTALHHLTTHPHEAASTPSPPSSSSPNNLPLAESYRRCISSLGLSVGLPPPPFSLTKALIRIHPSAVSIPIRNTVVNHVGVTVQLGGGPANVYVSRPCSAFSLGGRREEVDVCRGFTPLHAVALLSRFSIPSSLSHLTRRSNEYDNHDDGNRRRRRQTQQQEEIEASLAFMIQSSPLATHILTHPRRWTPLHAACAPDGDAGADGGSTPSPPNVRVLEWLVGSYPGSVVVENLGGVCPLTMFWQRYYVEPEGDGGGGLEGLDGHWFGGEEEEEEEEREEYPPVVVRYPDLVWRVLRLMIEAAYYTRQSSKGQQQHNNNNDDDNGDDGANPCFQSTTTRVRFQRCHEDNDNNNDDDDNDTVIEMQQYVVTPERHQAFCPLVALAGFPETTRDMMRFAIERCSSRCAAQEEESPEVEATDTTHSHSIHQPSTTTITTTTTTDQDGNTPLHIASSLNRTTPPTSSPSYRCTTQTLISLLLTHDPTAAQRRNHKGEYPVSLAVRCGMRWEDDGLELLVGAFPGVLEVVNVMGYERRGEFLFMAAAAVREGGGGGKEDGEEEMVRLDSCYRLLRSNPEGCSMRHRHID